MPANREYIRAMMADPLADLPASARSLLADPPVTEKQLVELRAEWPSLPGAEADLAEAVRLFVITWDPLETSPPRPAAFAAVNIDPLELAVYLPCWSLAEFVAAHGATMADVLASAAAAVVTTGSAHRDVVLSGDYPSLAAACGQVPDLVGDLVAGLAGPAGQAAWASPAGATGSALRPSRVAAVSRQWDDIGLGMIQDAVQHAFGKVDLDRSLVELSARRPVPGCPACGGRRFNFPADLAGSRDEMCPVHRVEADEVIKRRMARGEVSNPTGWRAIADASRRLGLPHLPNGLATRLVGADQAMYEIPDADVLAERARTVVEATRWFEGRADDLGVALGEDPDFLLGLPDWLINLPLDLGRVGLGAEAVMVGEALARVDPEQQDVFEADIAVALAEAGQADQARERVAANITRWPDDFWVRVHAGDALAALGDVEGAEAHFRTAADIADADDDLIGRADALERIAGLQGERHDAGSSRLARTRPQAPARPPASVVRHQRRKTPSRVKRKRTR
jgi:hypothetical protein